jgi:hypothetical protein
MSASPNVISVYDRLFVNSSSLYNDYVFENIPPGYLPISNLGLGELILSYPGSLPPDTIINIINKRSTDATVYYIDDSSNKESIVPMFPLLSEDNPTDIVGQFQDPPVAPDRPTWRLSCGNNTTTQSLPYWSYPGGQTMPKSWWYVFANGGVAASSMNLYTSGAEGGSNQIVNFSISARNFNNEAWVEIYSKRDNVAIPQNTIYDFDIPNPTSWNQYRITFESTVSNLSCRSWNIFQEGLSLTLEPDDFIQLINMRKSDGSWYWERLSPVNNVNLFDKSPGLITFQTAPGLIDGPVGGYQSLNVVRAPSKLNIIADPVSGVISISSAIPFFTPVLQVFAYLKPLNNRCNTEVLLNSDGSGELYTYSSGNYPACGNTDNQNRGKIPCNMFKLSSEGETTMNLELQDMLFMDILYSNGVATDPYYITGPAAVDLFPLTNPNNVTIVEEGVASLTFTYHTAYPREISSIFIQNGNSLNVIESITANVPLTITPSLPRVCVDFEDVDLAAVSTGLVSQLTFTISTTSPELKLINLIVYCPRDIATSSITGEFVIYPC